MKVKPQTQYRIANSHKLLMVTKVENLPEDAQLVEGDLVDQHNNFLAPFVGVMADGIDAITGIKLIRLEDKQDVFGRPKKQTPRIRKVRKN
jgi:hypothetical protein